MLHLGTQISVTGAVAVLVLHLVMKTIGECPRMLIAVPIVAAYMAAWAALLGGFLWRVWA